MQSVTLGLVAVATALVACAPDVGDADSGGADAADDARDTSVTDGSNDAALDASDASTDAPSVITLHLKCAEGDQCEAGAPVCCATLAFGTDCVLHDLTSACATESQCPTTLEPFCTPTETVRLCNANTDCAEPDYDRCCAFAITGHAQTVVMCASQKMADAVDASCSP